MSPRLLAALLTVASVAAAERALTEAPCAERCADDDCEDTCAPECSDCACCAHPSPAASPDAEELPLQRSVETLHTHSLAGPSDPVVHEILTVPKAAQP
jgi:hypothetical protein